VPLECLICGKEAADLASLRRHQTNVHHRVVGDGRERRRKRRRQSDDGSDAGSAGAIAADGGRPPRLPTQSVSSGTDLSSSTDAVAADLRSLYHVTRQLMDAPDGHDSSVEPEFAYATLDGHVRAIYNHLADAQRALPIVAPRKRAKVGKFGSVRLRALQRFVLGVGGAGLSRGEQMYLYDFLDLWDRTKPGMTVDAGHNQTLREAFPKRASFLLALRDDLDDAVLAAGWRKVRLTEGGESYEAYFCSAMNVIRRLLKAGTVRYWSGTTGPAPPNDRRETPLDGDAFKLCEREVQERWGKKSCVLGLHLYSDSSQLSWSGGKFSPFYCMYMGGRWRMLPRHLLQAVPNCIFLAAPCVPLFGGMTHNFFLATAHKVYPIRMRLVNVDTGNDMWVTVAYVPVVKKLQEPSADDQARHRRAAILQRVLYAALTETIARSHKGLRIRVGRKKIRAFPRLLLYLCDQPEERAVLGLKGGRCGLPCSSCRVCVDELGAAEAVNAEDRDAVNALGNQLEMHEHARRSRQRHRRADLERLDSSAGVVPALAGFAGLLSEPSLLYKMIGFDALHVS